MKQLTILAMLTIFSTLAQAGDVRGNVSTIWVSPTSQYVMFSIESKNSDYHRCNESKRYAIDLGTVGGDVTAEMLHLAKQQDLTVFVKSLNTCNAFDAENVRFLEIQ